MRNSTSARSIFLLATSYVVPLATICSLFASESSLQGTRVLQVLIKQQRLPRDLVIIGSCSSGEEGAKRLDVEGLLATPTIFGMTEVAVALYEVQACACLPRATNTLPTHGYVATAAKRVPRGLDWEAVLLRVQGATMCLSNQMNLDHPPRTELHQCMWRRRSPLQLATMIHEARFFVFSRGTSKYTRPPCLLTI